MNKEKLKINIVMGPFYPIPPVRGLAVEKRQFAMAQEYAKAGHDVTMISRRFEGLPHREVKDGITHIRVPSFAQPKPGLLYRLLDLIYSMLVAVYMPKADITVTNSVSAPLILPLSKAGKIAVSVGRYPKGQMGFYRRATRLHAASRFIGDVIKEQSPQVAGKVHVVNNAISHDFAEAIEGVRSARASNITYLGRISREKGIDILIKAFADLSPRFPEWHLTLIGPFEIDRGGDGEGYLTELKTLAASAGSRIHFAGPLYGGREIIARLRQADIFVYPSVAEKGEAFGIAPVEAMACGCALVVSSLRCFEDFVEPEGNALVFDHRSNAVNNLASSLKRLLRDEELRQRLGSAAMKTAENFTPATIAQHMLCDFNKLVADA